MRDVETYLDRAEEALRLFALADGPESKMAILEIVRTWVRTAEHRAQRERLGHAALTARLDAIARAIARAGEEISAQGLA